MKKTPGTVVLTVVCMMWAASPVMAITYQYDALHRLTRVTYDDGAVIAYDYDAVGNRTMRIVNTQANSVYLALHVDPPNSGQVIRNPDMAWYPVGTPVLLTAEVGACTFLGWTGDVPAGHEQDNPLSIVMDDYKSVTLHVTLPQGDVNGDCAINTGDIEAFAAVLLGVDEDPAHAWAADLDGSGAADGADIQLFVDLLLAG